jgi:tripartite-type tricarboxylate transporter receptor subunit TctC
MTTRRAAACVMSSLASRCTGSPKKTSRRLFGSALSVALALLAGSVMGASPASSQSVEQFYSGKQVTLVIGGGEGGGYDFYGRLLAKYIGRHLPGRPVVVAQNMPGAGGVIAANYLYNAAPHDGTVIGIVGRAVSTQPLINPADKSPRYVATKFNWIGTPEQECGILIARLPSPIKTLQDLRNHELVLSGTTADSPSSFYPRLINKVLGTKFKVIDGYMSSPPAILAVERGEVDGHLAGSAAAPLRAQIDPWIKAGKIGILAQIGLAKDPQNGGAPLIMDLVETQTQTQILTLLLAQQTLAWPFLAPPGVPVDRVEALRRAFDATMTDPAFLAEAADEKVGVNPIGGAKVAALLDEIYASPKDVLALLAKLTSRN